MGKRVTRIPTHIASVLAIGLVCLASPAWAGPVLLMGVGAEDGGEFSQGPITLYRTVADQLLSNVTNGGTGLLVIGGGKGGLDEVTPFWNRLAGVAPAIPLTFVNGPDNIGSQSFAGFALLAVASDNFNTFFGGLTLAEHQALTGRAADIAAFVNAGGGLLGLSSQFGAESFGYLAALGGVASAGPFDYDQITPTAAGLAAGITDAFDSKDWDQTFVTFPAFLQVLATANRLGQPFDGQAAVIGGVTPQAPPPPPPPAPEIPEPGTLAIWSLVGVLGLGYRRYRQAR